MLRELHPLAVYDNNIIYNTVYRKSNTKGVYFVFRILVVYNTRCEAVFAGNVRTQINILLLYNGTGTSVSRTTRTDVCGWTCSESFFGAKCATITNPKRWTAVFFSSPENALLKRSKRTRTLQCTVILKFVYDYGYLRFTIL